MYTVYSSWCVTGFVTVGHAQLKSRSWHWVFLPLFLPLLLPRHPGRSKKIRQNSDKYILLYFLFLGIIEQVALWDLLCRYCPPQGNKPTWGYQTMIVGRFTWSSWSSSGASLPIFTSWVILISAILATRQHGFSLAATCFPLASWVS